MANKTDIKDLILKSKNQEWKAQKALYLMYADEMMSIAIRYTKDHSAAKDLVQETFLTFFKKIEQFDESKGALGAWMSRILINQALKDFRKNQRMVFVAEETFAAEVSSEISVIEKLEAEDILKLLKELPEGCRVIFNLKVVEGYSHTEIGALLGITASASRSQLTRAKKILRELILGNSSQNIFVKTKRKII